MSRCTLGALRVVLALATLCAVSAAEAQQRRRDSGPISVTVVNRGESTAQNLYITPSDVLAWGEDRLGKESLAGGARQTIRVDRAAGCRYDVRVVYADGDHEIEADVDLCARPTLALTGKNAVSPLRLVRLIARRPVSLFLVYNRTDATMNELHSGKTSHLEGMTVDAGNLTVGRFRRADGCAVNLTAEMKEGDTVFIEKHDLCAQPVVSITTPEKKTAIRIRNQSASSMVNLHIRPQGFEVWGGDRLGSDTLASRDMKRFNLSMAGFCVFDVKAVFGEGKDDETSTVNLCERKVIDITGPEIVTGKGDKKTPAVAAEAKETLLLNLANGSSRTIREVFASPARTRNWGDNLLDAPLARGATAGLKVDQDGTCLFDVKAIHEGGYEQRLMNHDLCKSDTVTIAGAYQNVIDGGGPEAGFPVSFANVGRAAARNIYLTPSTDTHWGEDRLGSNQLERRSRLDMRLPRAGGCLWDIKVGFEENVSDERRRVDLCLQPMQQLRKREKPGSVVSTGTGFHIDAEGHVLTNSHVVEGCRVVAIAREGQERVPLKVLREDADIDIALLKAEAAPSAFIPLRRSAESPARAGEKAVVIGYPVRSKLGVVNVTEGVVSAAGGSGRDQTRMQFTAPAQPGNSGGPILDSAGQAIGIVVSRLGILDDERASQNVNFGVSIAAVEAFLKEAGVTPPAAQGAEKPTPAIFEAANAAVLPLDCLE